jgi:hypothetical protein
VVATLVLLGAPASQLGAQEQGSFRAQSQVIASDTVQLGLLRQLQTGLEGHPSTTEGELAQIRLVESPDSVSPDPSGTRRWLIVISYLRN